MHARLRRYGIAGLALVASALPVGAAAQGGGAPPEIRTTQLAANFFTIEGVGGTIGVLVGPEGSFVVDGGLAAQADRTLAAIHEISSGPILYVVNTHIHGDHTGGNETLAGAGATILSRPEVRERLAHPAPSASGAPGTPAPPAALPTVNYDGPTTIHVNGEDVQLIPARAAHTDGDTWVRFPSIDVIMTGDYYRSLGYPNIDRGSGGSLNGVLAALETLIATAGPDTRIIPGHGALVDRTAIAANRDMILAIRDEVAEMVSLGMTLEQVIAAKPTAAFDASVPNAETTSERFIGQLYAELTAPR